MRKIIPIYSLALAAMSFLASCEDKTDDLGAITIEEAKYANNRMELKLQDNETLPLTIFTIPQSKKGEVNATFTTRHPEWLKVEGNILTPVLFSGGETIYDPESRIDTLTVTAGGLSVNYVVIISNHIKRVREINLTAAGANIQIKKGGGEKGTFNLASAISFTPSDAYDKSVSYESSDESIAKVSPDGIVTSGNKEGKAVITITSLDGSGSVRTANVNVLGFQPVDLNRNRWTAVTSAALEQTGFNYVPSAISWIPDKVSVNGVHTLVGSPSDMFDGNALTYFCMEKPGRGEYSCQITASGWSGSNQAYGVQLKDLILSVGGDPDSGTSANPDADVVNYFIVDMKKVNTFSYLMWCHRNAANNRVLTIDMYGSNDESVYVESANLSARKWTKLNTRPLDLAEITTNAEQRIDINGGEQFSYRFVKVVALAYPSSGMTFGVAEFNLGINQ